MPGLIEIPLVNAQFGGGRVTLTVRHPMATLLLDATEADLNALLPDEAPAGANWGNSEALLAAQTLIDARYPDDGYVVIDALSEVP
jgi:hypothetical protein